jgi:hypothetical protein
MGDRPLAPTQPMEPLHLLHILRGLHGVLATVVPLGCGAQAAVGADVCPPAELLTASEAMALEGTSGCG